MHGTSSTAPLDSQLLGQSLYTADAIRVGKAYPRQRNYHGYYWMASTGSHVWHESLLERDSLTWLDHTGDIVAVAAQPMMLTASDGTRHYPDFLALDASGVQTMYDVKPAARINESAKAQFEWTRHVCEAVGWNYKVLTERPDQERVNLAWLALFRQTPNHPGIEAEEEVLQAAAPGWTIQDAVDHMPAASTPAARSRVFHLLWTRSLLVDLGIHLRPSTPVQVNPSRKGNVDGIA
ncbi:TnsA-like heteromeric transposase endonuclease subunit [Microbacterium lushaniae]|uniref:TnsA-like heteromeric transposase endonuclease subunit n=1 Tax=Microbacterium lushaniae TaxID=2614639 RepID=A0A5J6L8A0_9MICO|nr:TnsA-like heteromeric transposase endonuclease subunit [Microbacterium lushaniae]QEW04636.1 TnsA-like heteromeric transposase endonuclease subunit [Microbacterium lushaniae]